MSLIPEIPRFRGHELVNPGGSRVIGHRPDGHEIIEGRTRNITEPRLRGVPRSARESVLLSRPNLGELFSTVVRSAGQNSEGRRDIVNDIHNGLLADPEGGGTVLDNLAFLTDPDNVASEAAVAEATRIQRTLERRMFVRGQDLISSTADREVLGRQPVRALTRQLDQFRKLEEADQLERARAEARELLRDPDLVDQRFDTLTLIRAAELLSDRGNAALSDYEGRLTDAINHVLSYESPPYPTASGMEHWLTRWATDTEVSGQIAGNVIRDLVTQAETPTEITNVLYDVAVAGFSTGDPAVMMRTAELVGFQTDIMPGDSPQAINLVFSRIHLDPETRQHANEIVDAAYTYFAINSAQRQAALAKSLVSISKNYDYQLLVAQQYVDHPDEMKAMGHGVYDQERNRIVKDTTLISRITSRIARFRQGGLPSTFTTRDTEVGPLGEWFRDYYASISNEMRKTFGIGSGNVLAHLNFPDQPVTEVSKITPHEASARVQRHLVTMDDTAPIEGRTYWNTLGYLIPEGLGQLEWMKLRQQNVLLRDDLDVDKRHSLSPRGDHVEVMNDTLKGLGFKSLDFAMDEKQKYITHVTLRVGNGTYHCVLDRNYAFREIGSGHDLSLRLTAPFLEFVVLSHLHQIHCAEPGQKLDQEVTAGPPAQIEYRRAHRRVLPYGQNPTSEQIIKAWEEYGIDLVRQNADRLARGEERVITWVSQVKPEHVIGRDPVHNKGTVASTMLNDLLAA